MKYKIEFSEEKNEILKQLRGIGFEEIAEFIRNNKIISDEKHHNSKRYPRQRILIVEIKSYIYAVPYIVDEKRKVWFLKTIYPSRKLTKKYAK